MAKLEEHIETLKKLPINNKRAVLIYLDQLYRDHHTVLPDQTSAFFDRETPNKTLTFEDLLKLVALGVEQ